MTLSGAPCRGFPSRAPALQSGATRSCRRRGRGDGHCGGRGVRQRHKAKHGQAPPRPCQALRPRARVHNSTESIVRCAEELLARASPARVHATQSHEGHRGSARTAAATGGSGSAKQGDGCQQAPRAPYHVELRRHAPSAVGGRRGCPHPGNPLAKAGASVVGGGSRGRLELCTCAQHSVLVGGDELCEAIGERTPAARHGERGGDGGGRGGGGKCLEATGEAPGVDRGLAERRRHLPSPLQHTPRRERLGRPLPPHKGASKARRTPLRSDDCTPLSEDSLERFKRREARAAHAACLMMHQLSARRHGGCHLGDRPERTLAFSAHSASSGHLAPQLCRFTLPPRNTPPRDPAPPHRAARAKHPCPPCAQCECGARPRAQQAASHTTPVPESALEAALARVRTRFQAPERRRLRQSTGAAPSRHHRWDLKGCAHFKRRERAETVSHGARRAIHGVHTSERVRDRRHAVRPRRAHGCRGCARQNVHRISPMDRECHVEVPLPLLLLHVQWPERGGLEPAKQGGAQGDQTTKATRDRGRIRRLEHRRPAAEHTQHRAASCCLRPKAHGERSPDGLVTATPPAQEQSSLALALSGASTPSRLGVEDAHRLPLAQSARPLPAAGMRHGSAAKESPPSEDLHQASQCAAEAPPHHRVPLLCRGAVERACMQAGGVRRGRGRMQPMEGSRREAQISRGGGGRSHGPMRSEQACGGLPLDEECHKHTLPADVGASQLQQLRGGEVAETLVQCAPRSLQPPPGPPPQHERRTTRRPASPRAAAQRALQSFQGVTARLVEPSACGSHQGVVHPCPNGASHECLPLEFVELNAPGRARARPRGARCPPQ